jgi:hypothetical protein
MSQNEKRKDAGKENNDYIIFINQLGLGTCISWKGLILRRNVRNPYYLQTKATF